MSASLLHYRAWRGTFRPPVFGVWPITRVALGMLFRRRLFWVLYAFGLLLFALFFFGAYLFAWAESRPELVNIQVGKFNPSEQQVTRFFRQARGVLNGSHRTFQFYFFYQGSIVVITLALVGSVLVGNDYTFRSLPFYLAKPIRRWHYVAGKCLAVAVAVLLLSTLPALGLYAQH